MNKFRTPHTPHVRVTAQVGGESKTHQSFKDQCDINRIMSRYQKTGQLPELIRKNPVYGDFASAPDYHTAQNIVVKANEQFALLDARVRERFANEPLKFLEWATDPKNAKEMASLGLMKPEAVQRVANEKAARKKEASVTPKEPEAKK